jgi:hypothetical protein
MTNNELGSVILGLLLLMLARHRARRRHGGHFPGPGR